MTNHDDLSAGQDPKSQRWGWQPIHCPPWSDGLKFDRVNKRAMIGDAKVEVWRGGE